LALMVLLIASANIAFRNLPLKRLVSGNMEPTYSKGDILIHTEAEYAVEDIIIYETSRAPSVVRIIEMNDGTYKDFMKGRKEANYHFVGNPTKKLNNKRTQIFISFGTVVMDNLWNNQEEVQKGMKKFIGKLAELWKEEKVVFVTQGKTVLNEYPKSWKILDYADQVEELSRSKLFVTHGGSNSFHEAYVQQTRMAVIPFFGDQILVANQVEKLGLGVNLVKNTNIDTRAPKTFLNEELAEKLVELIE